MIYSRDSSVSKLFVKTDSIREVIIVVKEVDIEKLTTNKIKSSELKI